MAATKKRHKVARRVLRKRPRGTVEIRGSQSPAFLARRSDDPSVKWSALVRDHKGEVVDGAASTRLFDVEDWAQQRHPGKPVTLVRPRARR